MEKAVGLNVLLDNLLYKSRAFIQQEQKEKKMTTNTVRYLITSKDNMTTYASKDEAVTAAKRYVGDRRRSSGDEFEVYQLVATVTSPVPEAIVTEIA